MKSARHICILAAALTLSSAFAQPAYETALKNLKFRSIGPATMGGRIDDIAVVESDPRIIYMGAAGGGLFKTVNAGVTWQALFEDQPNPSIGDIAIAPSNPSIVYVGTGEANNRQSSSWGNGVYKTMDGGRDLDAPGALRKRTTSAASWCIRPTRTWSTSRRSAICGDRTRSAAFTRAPTAARPGPRRSRSMPTPASPISRSTRRVPNILYAAAYQHRRTVFGYNGGGPSSGIYRSTDGGAHWTKLARGCRPLATWAAARSTSIARTATSSTR